MAAAAAIGKRGVWTNYNAGNTIRGCNYHRSNPRVMWQSYLYGSQICQKYVPPPPRPLAQIGNVCWGAGYTDQFTCYTGEYHAYTSNPLHRKITCIRALCSGGAYTDDVEQCPNLDPNSLSIATSGGIPGSLAEFNLNGAGYSCGNGQTLSFDRKGIMGAAIQLYRNSGNNPNPHQFGIRMGPRSSRGHFDYMFNFYHDHPLYCRDVNNLHCDCAGNFHDMIRSNENAPARAIACKYTIPPGYAQLG